MQIFLSIHIFSSRWHSEYHKQSSFFSLTSAKHSYFSIKIKTIDHKILFLCTFPWNTFLFSFKFHCSADSSSQQQQILPNKWQQTFSLIHSSMYKPAILITSSVSPSFQSKVTPTCGRMVGFSGINRHGVNLSWKEERCALVVSLEVGALPNMGKHSGYVQPH